MGGVTSTAVMFEISTNLRSKIFRTFGVRAATELNGPRGTSSPTTTVSVCSWDVAAAASTSMLHIGWESGERGEDGEWRTSRRQCRWDCGPPDGCDSVADTCMSMVVVKTVHDAAPPAEGGEAKVVHSTVTLPSCQAGTWHLARSSDGACQAPFNVQGTNGPGPAPTEQQIATDSPVWAEVVMLGSLSADRPPTVPGTVDVNRPCRNASCSSVNGARGGVLDPLMAMRLR